MDSWKFFIGGVEYTISCDDINKDGSYYSIQHSPEPGLSIGGENERGIVFTRNDTVYFTAIDSTTYFICNNYLYGYKNIDKVKVKKKYQSGIIELLIAKLIIFVIKNLKF